MTDERTPGRFARSTLHACIAAAAAVASMVCAGLGWLHYAALEFNELGRHFDEQAQVVITDSAFAWFVPAGVFAALALLFWRLRAKALRRPALSSRPPEEPR